MRVRPERSPLSVTRQLIPISKPSFGEDGAAAPRRDR
jgi:hypothetical protein